MRVLAAVVVLSLSALGVGVMALPDVDAMLVARQDSTDSGDSSSSTTAPPSKTTAPSQTTDSPNTFNLNTAEGPSSTGKGAKGNSTKTSKGPTHSQFNPVDPAGGVVMVTPAPLAPTQLYKIGDTITWGWNYTNLQGTPTAIDILASVASVSRTYTLTQNMTFSTRGSFTWDTKAYQTLESVVANPLPVQQYTLVIFDADASVTDTPDAGYLGTFEGFTFGMYTPQPYTPLASGWQCASCSAAVSDMDRRALGFALTMCLVTVLSFTWFVTGFAVAL